MVRCQANPPGGWEIVNPQKLWLLRNAFQTSEKHIF